MNALRPLWFLLLAMVFLHACTSNKKVASSVSETHANKQHNTDASPSKSPAEKPAISPAAEKERPEDNSRANSKEHQALYAFVREWEGVPYHYGMCSKNGTDCSGLAGQLYKDVYGKTLPRSSSEIAKASQRIEMDDIREGDLLFFKINGRTISHVGVYLEDGSFIHASTKRGVMISHLNEDYYKRTFSHAGRL